jgi:hypothetical protein
MAHLGSSCSAAQGQRARQDRLDFVIMTMVPAESTRATRAARNVSRRARPPQALASTTPFRSGLRDRDLDLIPPDQDVND